MRTNYLLIDMENVQPDHLTLVNGGQFKVKLFLGENQAKVSVDLARSLQALGPDAVEYIKLSGNGKNALDFHIAFYIGQLAAAEPTAYFHIISNDTGFNPLIKHLKSLKIHCQRSSSIDDIPLVKLAHSKSLPDKVDGVIANLTRRKSGRPRTLKTLESSIRALFQGQLSDDEFGKILKSLTDRKAISIADGKVSYHLDQ